MDYLCSTYEYNQFLTINREATSRHRESTTTNSRRRLVVTTVLIIKKPNSRSISIKLSLVFCCQAYSFQRFNKIRRSVRRNSCFLNTSTKVKRSLHSSGQVYWKTKPEIALKGVQSRRKGYRQREQSSNQSLDSTGKLVEGSLWTRGQHELFTCRGRNLYLLSAVNNRNMVLSRLAIKNEGEEESVLYTSPIYAIQLAVEGSYI